MPGIYLHIPFCKQACYYCDFHFSTNTAIKKELIHSLAAELEMQKNYLHGEKINTIYFGGGTPSMLEAEELEFLLNTINDFFTVDPQAEITLEANPDDLNKAKLVDLKTAGSNRLSIGIQSFNDHTLKYLNRVHNSDTAIACIHAARQAGFKNISIDLIYAIPDRSEEVWKDDVRQALALEPEHISAYSLTIEKKTVFGHRAAQGTLRPTADDLAAAQLEVLIDALETQGYIQYEVSNFCKAGFESKHNSSYWRQEKYLGIGPSAHSYNHTSRQYNISNNHLYVRAIQQHKIPCEYEVLSRADHINEYLMTALRTSWGVDLIKLKEKFNYDILSEHKSLINHLLDYKLAIRDRNFLILTKNGRFLADKISSDLFLVS